MANAAVSIEEIIRQSTLEVSETLVSNLRQVPPDDLGEARAWLERLIRIMFYEEMVNGRWATTGIVGYVGREESSNEYRIIWKLSLKTPLASSFRLGDDEGRFALLINERRYIFDKVTGNYLGCTPVEPSIPE